MYSLHSAALTGLTGGMADSLGGGGVPDWLGGPGVRRRNTPHPPSRVEVAQG